MYIYAIYNVYYAYVISINTAVKCYGLRLSNAFAKL